MGKTFFKPNVKTLRRDQKQIAKEKAQSGGTSFLTLEEGENIVRLLPPTHKGQGLYTGVGTHWKLSADVKFAICPRITFGKPCPVCEHADKLKKKLTRGKDDKWRKLYRKYCPRRQYYYLAIDRGEKKPEPCFLTAGRDLHHDLLTIVNSSGYRDVWDVKKGRDIIINRTGQGTKTTYKALPIQKRTPLSKKKRIVERIAKACPDVKEGLKSRLLTYKDLKKLVRNPLKSKTKSHGKKKKKKRSYDEE